MLILWSGQQTGSSPIFQPIALPADVDGRGEALRLGVSDAAAVLHILRMPDATQRRQYDLSLAEELQEFERPMPVLDDCDLLLADTTGAIQ